MLQLSLLSVCLLTGLLMSRPAKVLHLPAVTGYLAAGLLLGPFLLGRLGIPMLGFGSLEEVAAFSVISQTALGFIAFTIGNEFRLSQLRAMGSKAIIVGVFQAVITTAVLDLALIALHLLAPALISIPAALTLGAIGAATAPAATLMVVRQYKADGPLTRLLLLVVAIDDAVGLVLFALSFGAAQALTSSAISVVSVLVEPVVEIVLSVAAGSLFGLALNYIERFFHSRSKRLSISIAFVALTVAVSGREFTVAGVHCGFSLLLTCMMMGTVFCNVCDFSEELMNRVDGWTTPLFVLFFVLSGAELDLGILTHPPVLLVGVTYIVFRSLGKISGAYLSTRACRFDEKIQKHLGVTLLPQAGVAMGMAITAQTLPGDGALVQSIVLFSVLVYELLGPVLTKRALTAAGEICAEGKTSARRANA